MISRIQPEIRTIASGTTSLDAIEWIGNGNCEDQVVVLNRRAVNDAAISLSTLVVLLLALVAIDDRVREQIALRVSAGPAAQISDLGSRAGDVVSIVAVAARNQSIEHAPLMIFALAAVVLVLFMLRIQ